MVAIILMMLYSFSVCFTINPVTELPNAQSKSGDEQTEHPVNAQQSNAYMTLVIPVTVRIYITFHTLRN